jgi:hypothetical protein
MGRRGPKPGGGGRPRKPLEEKVLTGRAKYDQALVISFPDAEKLEGCPMPKPSKYLSAAQKNGEAIVAEEIFTLTWEWLHKRNCSHLIYPQLLEQYAMSAARWIQCEKAISEFGFLAKHPTTGSAIQSPFVAISQNYLKQTMNLWAQIYQIVRENSESGFEGASPQDSVMERLLSARRL